MSTKQSNATAIEKRIAGIGSYANLTVGITQDWTRRKDEHSNDGKGVACWTCWEADSLSDAREVESCFLDKGMKGGGGGNMANNKTTYVYIF
jgi:hypothetical protein